MPVLARDLPTRLLLLDPARGLSSLARQISSMAEAAGGRIHVVDIGGDILTHGNEPGLCSPFGDALTLAACHLTGIPATVHIAGPGLDGEIGEQPLLERLAGSRPLTPDRDAAAAAARALAWHPSEASALWAAAVHGARGTVRTVNSVIRLTDVSPRLYPLPLQEAIGHNPVARALVDERPATLDAAGLSHRLTGIPGLESERTRTPRQDPPAGGIALLATDTPSSRSPPGPRGGPVGSALGTCWVPRALFPRRPRGPRHRAPDRRRRPGTGVPAQHSTNRGRTDHEEQAQLDTHPGSAGRGHGPRHADDHGQSGLGRRAGVQRLQL